MSTEPTPGPHAGMYPTITRKPRRWPWIAGIAAALFVGIAIGGVGEDVQPVADVEPEPAVTVTAEPEVVTETLEVTPAICIEALDASEIVTHESVIPAMDAMSDAMFAAADFDTAGIVAATETIEALTDDLGPQIEDYNAAATACRLLTES